MGKRSPKRPQIARKCIFCDRNASSKEHFWSEWMHELLPTLPNVKHNRQTFSYHPSVGHKVRGPTGRQGDLRTVRIRAVCKECNEGWMNIEVEQRARPYLTPLITGDPVTLTPDQMKLVADWIALKCMVAEHASPNSSVTPRRERVTFMERREIPSYYRIYIANHNCGTGTGFNRHSVCAGINSPTISPSLEGTSNNIQTITFLLGRIVVHLNAARIDNFVLESRVIIPLVWGFCRLWPRSEITDPAWPRRPLLSKAGVKLLSNIISGYMSAGTVTWLDRPA